MIYNLTKREDDPEKLTFTFKLHYDLTQSPGPTGLLKACFQVHIIKVAKIKVQPEALIFAFIQLFNFTHS